MATVSLPYTLTPGTPENVTQLMANLNALVAGVNAIDAAQIADGSITAAKIAAANKDGTAGTASMRTLGTGALQAAAGNHTHTLAAITDAGTAASRNVPTSGNATSTQVVLGSDTRLATTGGAGATGPTGPTGPTGATGATGPSAASALLHVRDEKTSGTAGGSFTSGAWRTRDLNASMTNTITGASLGSNQITLPSGTYWIDASAPALKVDSHRLKLYNTTASADILLGTTEYGVNANSVDAQTKAFVRGAFTLSGTSVLELQHRCTVTYNTNGFGVASGLGTEVYSDVVIWKTA